MKKILTFLVIPLIVILFSNCSNNDNDLMDTLPPEEIEVSPNVKVYNPELLENSLVFGIKNGGTNAFLINKIGDTLHDWNFDTKLGNDLELLPNGKLIGIFKSENPDFSFGGYGGIIRILNPDDTIEWEYEYASETYIAHHDVELLPNGNVLFLAWEKVSSTAAQEAGVNTEKDIYPEVLIEVDAVSKEIVWEWHSFDHIIQESFPQLPNYGVIKDNPDLININYNEVTNGDIMHANGIDYDPLKNVIYVSVNFYSEVWVIDHSTSTVEASTNIGGTYDKGGRLLYRFGNPETYNGLGERLFYNNHFPNLIEDNKPGTSNILIYMNGFNTEQSIVYELDMPDSFSLQSGIDNEPKVVWQYTHPDLYYDKISGAVRLKNGNTLICEGDFGFWEVTPNKEIAWKYEGNQGNTFWRCYSYELNSSAITSLE